MRQEEIERSCGNCSLFEQFAASTPKAIDVATEKVVPAGQRKCSAGNVAWADSFCPTGQFKPTGTTDNKTI